MATRNTKTGGSQGASADERLPPLQLDAYPQWRKPDWREARPWYDQIRAGQAGRVLLPPPAKPWAQMTAYERGWAIAYAEQEQVRASMPHDHDGMPNQPQAGADMRVEVTLTFAEAVSGTEKEVRVPRFETGHGEQRVQAERRLRITIPAGMDDGMQIRIAGQGDAGMRGGAPGNLYVVVRVLADAQYRRDGTTIYSELTITPTQAENGGRIEVPTVDGRSQPLIIPAESQTGTAFRLPGKGIPDLRTGERGVQVVMVRVDDVDAGAVASTISPETAQTTGTSPGAASVLPVAQRMPARPLPGRYGEAAQVTVRAARRQIGWAILFMLFIVVGAIVLIAIVWAGAHLGSGMVAVPVGGGIIVIVGFSYALLMLIDGLRNLVIALTRRRR